MMAYLLQKLSLIRSISDSNHFIPWASILLFFSLLNVSWDGALLRTSLRGFLVASRWNNSSNLALAVYCLSYSRPIQITEKIARVKEKLIAHESQLEYLSFWVSCFFPKACSRRGETLPIIGCTMIYLLEKQIGEHFLVSIYTPLKGVARQHSGQLPADYPYSVYLELNILLRIMPPGQSC